MDDGADLVSTLHTAGGEQAAQVFGGTEETTTGVIRLRSMANRGVLNTPSSPSTTPRPSTFRQSLRTGQSTIDGIVRSTNRLLAGSTFVVCGYGWCGRGWPCGPTAWAPMSSSLRSILLGRSKPSWMAYRCSRWRGAKVGDFFVTLTGNTDVIG